MVSRALEKSYTHTHAHTHTHTVEAMIGLQKALEAATASGQQLKDAKLSKSLEKIKSQVSVLGTVIDKQVHAVLMCGML